jgi:nickel transport protein
MIAVIRCFFAVAAAVVLAATTAPDALAHRVNVFAYVEGDAVHVECSYSRSDRVRFGELVVQNAATGQEYLTGKTDEQGNFVFAVPAAARAAKADLRIVLKAGEGHLNDTVVKAEEYAAAASAPAGATVAPAASAPAVQAAAAAKPGAPAATATPVASGPVANTGTGSVAKAGAVASAAAPSAGNPCLDAAALRPELEAVVEAAVEKKIAPIRKMLLDDKEKGPGMPEIFGGIGWLVGLAGLAAWAKSRKGGKGA